MKRLWPVLLSLLVLSGCATELEVAPVPTVTVTATTSPAPTPPAAARTADAPLEAIDAYALCKSQTSATPEGDFALLSWAAFAEAQVVRRDDGDWFVRIDMTDQNRTDVPYDNGAVVCIVGGTIGSPSWSLFGNATRESADQMDPNYEELGD